MKYQTSLQSIMFGITKYFSSTPSKEQNSSVTCSEAAMWIVFNAVVLDFENLSLLELVSSKASSYFKRLFFKKVRLNNFK